MKILDDSTNTGVENTLIIKQFDILFKTVLQKVYSPDVPYLIIIDAIDECGIQSHVTSNPVGGLLVFRHAHMFDAFEKVDWVVKWKQ